jgi:hypothetical protein
MKSASGRLLSDRLGLAISCGFLLLALCALSFVARAYERPLTEASIHDAWVLGQRNDQATAEFRAPYIKQVAGAAPAGPHIAEIEVLTPFVQIVDRSQHKLSTYSEEQAAKDYHERGDKVLVRVLLMLPAAYPKQESGPGAATSTPQQKAALRPENFWQNFHFNVTQHGKTIASGPIQSQPVYSAATKGAPSVLDGARVLLDYDAKDIAPEPLTVQVVTPETKTIAATFDLQKLR